MPRAPLKRLPAGAAPRRPSTRWLAPVALALLSAVVYLNALHNPFVYDDRDTVTANPSIVEPSNIRFLLVYSPFRPVVNISYAIDRLAWGPGPTGFHVTSTALHALVVVLLYFLQVGLLRDAGLSRGVRAAAFTGAAVFAVHPIQTEAVGYISGRSEVLCGVWFLCCVLAARRAIQTGSRGYAAGAIISGALALASKEIALVLPVVILAWDGLLGPGGMDARRRRLRRYYLPACAVLLVAGAVRLVAFGGVSAAPQLAPAMLNLLTQSLVVWRYAGLILWPHGQAIMHGVHRVTSFADLSALTALAGLLFVCLAAFRVRRSAPVTALGILWFFAVLAPSSSIIALREGMAEHRVYLAGAGLFLIAAEGLARWLGTHAALPRAFVATMAGLVLLLGALTVRRNEVWSSPVRLWTEATVRAAGMWEPHYALADSLREAGDCHAAVSAYRTVVGMFPTHRDAHTNLGICLAQSGDLEKAERSFRRALEIDPGFVRGYTNLGALALVAGDAVRARDFYLQALAHDSGNVLARLQLASLYEHTFKDHHAAASMCGEARRLAPTTPGVVECVERNQRLAAGAPGR